MEEIRGSPVDNIENLPLFTVFYTCQVVQDFWTIKRITQNAKLPTIWWPKPMQSTTFLEEQHEDNAHLLSKRHTVHMSFWYHKQGVTSQSPSLSISTLLWKILFCIDLLHLQRKPDVFFPAIFCPAEWPSSWPRNAIPLPIARARDPSSPRRRQWQRHMP